MSLLVRIELFLITNIEPEYEYLMDEVPFDKVRDRVVGANILRRHLTTGQRAMTAASLANMTVGGDRGNQYAKSQRENSTDAKPNEDAAKWVCTNFPNLGQSVSIHKTLSMDKFVRCSFSRRTRRSPLEAL